MSRVVALLLSFLILTHPEPAHAGPLAGLVPVVIGLIKASVALKLALTLVATVAISALQRAKRTKPRSPGITIERTLTGGVNSRTIILGEYCTAGSQVCPPMSGGQDGDTPNAYLTYVIALSDIPVDGLEALIINGEYVPFGGTHSTYGIPIHGKYANHAWFRFYDGTQTEADVHLMMRFGPSSGYVRAWSANDIGHGVAYAVLTFKYNPDIFKGEPEVKFVLRGAKLYDPRYDSTVGGAGAQRWGQPHTYGYTLNGVVMNYNILRGITFADGTKWGGECEFEDVPLANWVAAMNVCDEVVVTADGPEPRYRAGYEVRVAEDEPADIIEQFVKSYSGAITEVGGIYKTRAGGPGLPVLFLTDDDFLVSQGKDFDPFPGLNESSNGVFATYPHPEEQWNTHDAPSLISPEYIAADDGIEIFANISLPTVPYPVQVQRLMSAWLYDDRRWRRHSASLGAYAFVLEPMDTISWTSAHNGYVDKVFEISETEENLMSLVCQAAMREVDPSDYDWTAAQQMPDSIAPGSWDLPPVQAVPGFAVEPYTIVNEDGTPRRPAIRASWTPTAADDATALKIQVRVVGVAMSVADITVSRVQDGQTIISEGIGPNGTYEVRARYQVERATEWTSWLSVTTANVLINVDEIDGISQLEQELEQLAEDTEQALLDIQAAEQTVIAMQATVGALETDITTMQSEIVAQGAAILANAADITAIETTVASQQSAITSLQTTATSQAGSIASLTTSVSAGVAVGGLLQNPEFTLWPNATGAPTAWSSTAAMTRVGGSAPRPYAARVAAAANANSVYTQQYTAINTVRPEQWIMLEAEVTLDAGTFVGSGLLVYTTDNTAGNGQSVQTTGLNLRFAVDPDASGAVVGNGVVGRRYSFSRMVQLNNNVNHSRLRVMATAHVTSLGAITEANAVIFHRVNARPATAAEIEGRATAATVTTQATAISTLQGTVATLGTTVTAQGTSITNLQTASSTQAGQIATIQTDLVTANAAISTNATAITGLDSSVASLTNTVGTLGASVTSMQSAIDTVEGSVASLTTTVNAQGASITSMQTTLSTATGNIATLQTQVRSGGGNLLTNSEMTGSGGYGHGAPAVVSGWAYHTNNSTATFASVNGAGTPWMIGGIENNLAVFQSGAGQTGHEGLWYQDVAVQGLKYYEFSCMGAGHRCNVGVYVEWWNEGSSPIAYSPSYILAGTHGGGHLSNWVPLFIKQQAPAGALKARVIMIKYPTYAGLADSWGWFSRAQMVEVTATEASPVPYSPGNSRATITTQQASINGLFARWGVELDVNGYITGFVMNNNGQRGDFTIRADKFAVIAPGGGARTEYYGGAWKVFDELGRRRVQMGNLLV